MNDYMIQDTPEKFRAFAEEIVPPLLALLRARNALEAEIFARSREMEAEKPALGLPMNQMHPEEPALWEEYRSRYMELIEHRCVPGLLKYGAARSFGMPTKYGYLDEDPECQVIFTMKSAKKAVVETRRGPGVKEQHQFVLRPSGDGAWLIGGVSYRLSPADGWSVEHSV